MTVRRILRRTLPTGVKRYINGQLSPRLRTESVTELLRSIDVNRTKTAWGVRSIALLTAEAAENLGRDRRTISDLSEVQSDELTVVDPKLDATLVRALTDGDFDHSKLVSATTFRHFVRGLARGGRWRACLPSEVTQNPVYNFKVRCPRLQLLFHEVPKNASSTSKAVLFGLEQEGRLNPHYHWFGSPEKWQSAFPEMRVADAADCTGLFSFAFLRNPWDRIHSAYHNSGWRFHYADLSFTQFVHTIPERLTDKNDMVTSHIQPFRHFVPFEAGKPAVDFLGKFEHYATDLEEVVRTAGFRGNITFPTINPSERNPYRRDYDTPSRRIVERLYGDEIELGQYQF